MEPPAHPAAPVNPALPNKRQPQLGLVHTELVATQQGQQRGRGQLQETTGPEGLLWVQDWVREEQNEGCGVGSSSLPFEPGITCWLTGGADLRWLAEDA